MTKSVIVLFILLVALSFSCSTVATKNEEVLDSTVVQGELIIFHASSMIEPMGKIITSFEAEYPHVKIKAEGSGSRKAARKIIERNRKCDVLISSDYQVIKNLLIPNFTDWYIEFAGNEMVIAYNSNSKKQEVINSQNWYKILLEDDVHFGRADPDYDPSGYRAVICIKLTELYYDEYGIKDKMLFKDKKFILAKDMDLAQLLKEDKVDYIFVYKSVAEQSGFKYIELPEQINLKSRANATYYAQAKTKISGKMPGKYIEYKGAPIRYAITQIRNAPNPRAAEAFIQFFIDKSKGLEVLKRDKMSILDSIYIMPQDSTTLEIREQMKM
jgi:molybdate/tungstate transport system substrate-binding protein